MCLLLKVTLKKTVSEYIRHQNDNHGVSNGKLVMLSTGHVLETVLHV